MGTGCAEEVAAVELYFVFVYLVGLLQAPHIEEILLRAAYNVGVFQILDDGGSQLDGLLFMGRTEIGIVVDNGMHVVCAFQ